MNIWAQSFAVPCRLLLLHLISMYSAHLPIHVEILDAVKYYSSNLKEWRSRQLWVYAKVHSLLNQLSGTVALYEHEGHS